MKKRLYVLISALVIVLLIIVVIYALRESKDSVSAGIGNEAPEEAGAPSTKPAVVEKKTARLFEEMPSVQKLHDQLKDKDFVMVAIDLQEPGEPVKRYIEEYKFTFLTLLDSNGDVGLLFGIRSIPTTLILDKQGMVIGAAIGARDWGSKKSIALFEHLINQEVELSS